MKHYREYELDLEIYHCEHCGSEFVGPEGIFPGRSPKEERCVECAGSIFDNTKPRRGEKVQKQYVNFLPFSQEFIYKRIQP